MSRRIVFVNQATGYLTIDIINEFVAEFDEIALITGSIRVQNTSLNPKVKISRIIKYSRGNIVSKSISWLVATIQIFFLLKTKYRDFEKFYFTIPPTAYLFAANQKSSFSVLIFDLYPDALAAYGFSVDNLIWKWWSKKNRMIFPIAECVFTLSDKMGEKILNYSKDTNLRVISNWSAFSGMGRVTKDQNKFRNEFGLQGRFIVQYSGNIGFTHNLEALIEVADLLKNNDEILFVIIGRGKRKDAICDLVNKKGLKNCIIMPFRKDEDLFDSLCAANLAVITLDDRTPDVSVPSKTFNILAAGTPVMVIASQKSEISNLIVRHRNGKVFEKNDLFEMKNFILDLKDNPEMWTELSGMSLKASEYYTSHNAAKYLEFYRGEK